MRQALDVAVVGHRFMIAMTAIPVIQPPAYHGYVTQSHLNVLSPFR